MSSASTPGQPHGSMRKPQNENVKSQEEQQLEDAQVLATPDAQEELSSSQTKEEPSEDNASRSGDVGGVIGTSGAGSQPGAATTESSGSTRAASTGAGEPGTKSVEHSNLSTSKTDPSGQVHRETH